MKSYDFNLGMPRYGLPPKLLLIVRLIIIILTTCFLQVSAAGYAQRLTYAKKNTTLEEVFQQIEKQTGYQVLYADRKVDDSKTIHVNFKNAELVEVLDYSLKGLDLDYEITGKTIVIKPRDKTFLERVVAALTNTNINCRVVDADGKGLPGASVAVKGKNKTVSTDQNGEFFIRGVEEKDILVVSYVGYQPLEISVKEAVSLGKIVLKEIVGELDEVRLIGYGTTTQRLSTGNTSKITAEDIEKQPVANPLQTLQGRMPGVLVTNGQGLPGTETKIQIRGINSIGGNRDPLYIVDGVPFSATALYDVKVGGALGGFQNAASGLSFTPFNSISPSDIESIDVLKDADATAIYGARGANGVVLITTKKGKAGKTKFDININHGIEQASRLMKDFLTTKQYVMLEKEGAKNDGYDINDIKELLPEIFKYDQNQNTDWQKVILGNITHLTNVAGSISGGNSGTTFLLGGNYHKEGTIYPGDLGYTRGGAHLSMGHNLPNDRLIASMNVNYTSDKNNLIYSTLPTFYLPNFPLYTENGLLNFDGGGNYLALLQQKSTTKTDNLMASSHIGYKILENLIFKTGLGFNRISLNGFSILPMTSQNPAFNPNNQAQYANNTSTTFNIEPQFDYCKNIGSGKLQAIIGGTYQYTTSKGDFIKGENYKDENLFGNLAGAGLLKTYLSTYSQYKYVSIYSRLNYNLHDKYILNISYRRDGSSRFGPGKQFGDFGAVGAAWFFSKESFTNSLFPFLSYGKLRASYGIVGNEPASNYQYLQSYNVSFYGTYNGNTSTNPSRLANPDFRWELNKKMELGIETGFLKDRILLTTSWFRNRTANQLVNYSLPSQTGFQAYTFNLPAVVQNTGLEFSLNTTNIQTQNFTWRTNFNLSFIQNKLVSYPGLEVSSYKNQYQIGESLSIKKNALFAEVDPKTGAPLFYSSTGEEILDPSISGKDQFQKIGKTMPDYYGGLTNTMKYRNLELSFLFQFVKQEGYRPSFVPGELHSYMPEEALQRWQKEGDITNIPKASLVAPGNAPILFRSSNYFWGDASYIKLKNLSLSYSFPSLWAAKVKINQLKIYAQGQNLFTITKYKGTDPENPSQALSVPMLRVISVGIQLTL